MLCQLHSDRAVPLDRTVTGTQLGSAVNSALPSLGVLLWGNAAWPSDEGLSDTFFHTSDPGQAPFPRGTTQAVKK